MYNRRVVVVSFFAALFLFLPIFVAAQGLVPCGDTGNLKPGTPEYYAAATSCQACNVVDLIQEIINFMLGLSIPIAIGLFAYAGFLYFSSAEKPDNIKKAKNIFKSAFIGFVIALSGYMIVNTVLHAVVTKEYSDGWNSIQCVNKNQRNTIATVGELLGQANEKFANNSNPAVVGSNPICESGYYWDATISACYNPRSDSVRAPISYNVMAGNVAQCAADNRACSPAALQAAGFDQTAAAVMSCIAVTENSGQASGCNGNACGTFQIMLTVNPLVGPACGGTLDCPSLCKGRDGVAVNTAACQTCVQAANGALCNAQAAYNLYKTAGYKPWTTSSDNTKSGACLAKYGAQ